MLILVFSRHHRRCNLHLYYIVINIWGRFFFWLSNHRLYTLLVATPPQKKKVLSPFSLFCSARCFLPLLRCQSVVYLRSLSCPVISKVMQPIKITAEVSWCWWRRGSAGGCSLFLLCRWASESLLQRRPSAPINQPNNGPNHWCKAGKKKTEKTFSYFLLLHTVEPALSFSPQELLA